MTVASLSLKLEIYYAAPLKVLLQGSNLKQQTVIKNILSVFTVSDEKFKKCFWQWQVFNKIPIFMQQAWLINNLTPGEP